MSEIIFNEANHSYTHGGEPIINVTTLLEIVGYSDFSAVNQDRMEASNEFGAHAHKASYLEDIEELDENSLSAPLRPYLEGWRKFKRENRVTFVARERIVHSHRFNFVGTLDCVFEATPRKRVKLILADLKTSKNLYPATKIQTQLYKIAYEEETGKKINERWCIRLKENDYKVDPYKERTDNIYALSALHTYKFRKENNLL